MSFQFTSPNAAGAKANQEMAIALREALEEVQKTEAAIIKVAPEIAQIQGEAIQNQAEHEASQMRSQAIGTIVGGSAGLLSVGAELKNFSESTHIDSLIDEANLNESYASIIEDSVPAAQATTLESEAVEGNLENNPVDQVNTETQLRNLQARERIDRIDDAAENGNLSKDVRARTSTESQEEGIRREKNSLRRHAENLSETDRSALAKRFRDRAANQKLQAKRMESGQQSRTNLSQGVSQFINSTAQSAGNMAAAEAKLEAGIDQRQGQMAQYAAQSRQKTEDVASSQTKDTADALRQAINSQRNYYSSRG